MKKKMSKYSLICCGLMLCSQVILASEAECLTSYSSGPLELFISDSNPDKLVSHSFYVPDDITIDTMSITLDIGHGWVGDLQIALTHPNGEKLLYLSNYEPLDPNNNWNIFDLGKMYTFVDSGDDLPLSDDPRVGDDYIIPHGYYLPIEYPVEYFANTFAGLSAQGEWLLEIWDEYGQNDGLLQSWQINLGPEAGCLNMADFALTYGLTSEDDAFNRGCDFDKDNDIDGFDLAELM